MRLHTFKNPRGYALYNYNQQHQCKERYIVAFSGDPVGQKHALQYVKTSISSGKTQWPLKDHRTVIPLLDPLFDDVPFAMAIELASPDTLPKHNHHHKISKYDMYELRYVLSGQGKLVRKGGSESETISAGDTVLLSAGTASFEADKSTDSEEDAALNWGLASLVAYLPSSLVEVHQQGQNNQAKNSTAAPNIKGSSQKPGEKHVDWESALATFWPRHSDPFPKSTTPQYSRALSEDAVKSILSGAKSAAHELVLEAASQSEDDASLGMAVSTPGQNHHYNSSNILDNTNGHVSSVVSLAEETAQRLTSLFQSLFAPHEQFRVPTSLKRLPDLIAFRLPNQSNRLALVFDPLAKPEVPFVFGVEIFEHDHRTTPHVHPIAHELFFILSGTGEAFCNGEHFPISAGDVVCFRPGSIHGINNGPHERMYCLEMMVPNEAFAEFVRNGQPTGSLPDEDLCILARLGCT